MCKKAGVSVLMRLWTMKMKVKMKNRSHTYDINRLQYMDLNIKCVSAYWWICVLRNTLATFGAQFMIKFSNIESESKKSVACKKKRVNGLTAGDISTFSVTCFMWCTVNFFVAIFMSLDSTQKSIKSLWPALRDENLYLDLSDMLDPSYAGVYICTHPYSI